MKLLKKALYSLIILSLFTSTAFAMGPSHFGFTIPIVVASKDPDNVYAYRAVAWYQPRATSWNNDNFEIRFAANYGHWVSKGATQNHDINIYAIAPVFHLYIAKTDRFSPYFEASIGPAYMSSTMFAERNLGIHYTFQDELTIGALFGREHGFYVAFSALHYSNGSLSAHNSGITVPVILNLGYQFS
jgi:lipid A 3-O-deacylase